MKEYEVVIRGQFKFTSIIEADSPEEAQREAEEELNMETFELVVEAINNVRVKEWENLSPRSDKGEVRGRNDE